MALSSSLYLLPRSDFKWTKAIWRSVWDSWRTGIERRKVEKADVIIDEMMKIILEDSKIAAGDEVYVLVNGLGALPVMDQYVCYRRVDQILNEKGINIHRTDVGNFATSMDMVGMSVTLVKLDDEIKELLDAPCDTPYYKL